MKYWNMQNKVLRWVLLGVFAAAIAVVTTISMPIPGNNGYIHLGDGIILLGAMVLGPAGAIAAGVGSALADIMLGYVVYAPVSFAVKFLMGLLVGLFYRRKGGVFSYVMNIVFFILAELIMVAGYFSYECILYSFASALAGVPANAIQACSGIIIGAVFAPFVKKIKL